MKLSPAVKVGILTFLAIIVLIFTLMWLKGRAISAGERIEIRFFDVDGMRPGSAVSIMGIRIGQVEEVIPVIEKDLSYVKLKFVITEPNVKIPAASTISIQQSGIIGEKFLEITPPQIQTIFLPVKRNDNWKIEEKSPVELFVTDKYIPVGEIKYFEVVDTRTLPNVEKIKIHTPFAYRIDYIITKPGIVFPEGSTPSAFLSANGKYKLRFTPPDGEIVQLPALANQYNVIEPMRLKEFFDLQLQSAIALKETNDKINQLLSEESIADLKATMNNTKELTEKAAKTMDEASQLIATSQTEMQNVSMLATDLAQKIIVLTDSVNEVAGDPQFKKDIIATVNSLQKSSKQISEIISDPKFKETVAVLNDTTKDISEISKTINTLTKDDNVKAKLDHTIVNLDSSLDKLSKVLENVNNITDKDENKLKQIMNDSSDISENLKKFSEKLNKRFLLFRLMF